MKKLLMLVAFGAGYVAGAHAGRARYEQIKRITLRIKEDPRVQQHAHEAADAVRHGAHQMAERAKEHLPGSVNGAEERETFPITTRF